MGEGLDHVRDHVREGGYHLTEADTFYHWDKQPGTEKGKWRKWVWWYREKRKCIGCVNVNL